MSGRGGRGGTAAGLGCARLRLVGRPCWRGGVLVGQGRVRGGAGAALSGQPSGARCAALRLREFPASVGSVRAAAARSSVSVGHPPL